MNKKDKEFFRKLLHEQKEKLQDGVERITGTHLNKCPRDASGELSGYSYHMADVGTDNFEREFLLEIASSEQKLLYQIDEALKRLDEGTYGDCLECNSKISKQRLTAIPYANHCIKCQAQKETHRKRA